jgi:hypothetical protein
MRVGGAVGRSGILRYVNPDGSARVEYRPESEAFHADTLDTLRGAPVTLGHPGMVSAANFAAVAVGHASDTPPQRESDLLVTELVIQDARAIAAVERGDARELSLGYLMDFDPTPGTAPDGTRYDGVQRNVRINHVALVAKGRAGDRASLRLDSAGNAHLEEHPTMKIEVIEGTEYEVGTAPHKAACERRDSAARARQDEVTKLTGERDAALARASQAEARNDAEARGFGARVAARVKLEKQAQDHSVKVGADMSDDQIRRAVLAQALPAVRLDGKDEGYVVAAFDVAMATPRTSHLDIMAPPPGEREDEETADDLPPDERARLANIGGRKPHWET